MATLDTKKTPAISADVIGNKLVLQFANGEQLSLHASELSDTIRDAAIMHGLKQKLVDAAAIARNPDTGRSATAKDKYEAVKEVFDRITSTNGTWNKQRGDGAGAGNTMLVRALMQMTGKTRAEIDAFLAPKSKEEKAALRANAKVAAIIAELQAASSEIDTDDMLAGLMD